MLSDANTHTHTHKQIKTNIGMCKNDPFFSFNEPVSFLQYTGLLVLHTITCLDFGTFSVALTLSVYASCFLARLYSYFMFHSCVMVGSVLVTVKEPTDHRHNK